MFDNYICGITGLPCCGCSACCEHRKGINIKPLCTEKEVSESLMTELRSLTDEGWRMLNNMSNNFKLI